MEVNFRYIYYGIRRLKRGMFYFFLKITNFWYILWNSFVRNFDFHLNRYHLLKKLFKLYSKIHDFSKKWYISCLILCYIKHNLLTIFRKKAEKKLFVVFLYITLSKNEFKYGFKFKTF